jgi:hypothetical protein
MQDGERTELAKVLRSANESIRQKVDVMLMVKASEFERVAAV